MDNYQAIYYGLVAFNELEKRKKEITKDNLKAEMIYFMDIYSEKEIEKKYNQINE